MPVLQTPERGSGRRILKSAQSPRGKTEDCRRNVVRRTRSGKVNEVDLRVARSNQDLKTQRAQRRCAEDAENTAEVAEKCGGEPVAQRSAGDVPVDARSDALYSEHPTRL